MLFFFFFRTSSYHSCCALVLCPCTTSWDGEDWAQHLPSSASDSCRCYFLDLYPDRMATILLGPFSDMITFLMFYFPLNTLVTMPSFVYSPHFWQWEDRHQFISFFFFPFSPRAAPGTHLLTAGICLPPCFFQLLILAMMSGSVGLCGQFVQLCTSATSNSGSLFPSCQHWATGTQQLRTHARKKAMKQQKFLVQWTQSPTLGKPSGEWNITGISISTHGHCEHHQSGRLNWSGGFLSPVII